jgi:hypothetical protein
MRKVRAAMPLVAAVVAIWWITTASAQSPIPNYAYVRDASGQVFGTYEGQRIAIPIYPATEEQIAAMPWSGLWMGLKADGTGYQPGPKPEWADGVVPEAPAAAAPTEAVAAAPSAAAVTLNGDGKQNTKPFDLKAGSYTVKWSGSMKGQFGGNLIISLKRPDAAVGGNLLVNTIINKEKPSLSGETQVYNVKAGAHYLEVTAPGEWSVTISPL